MEGVFVVFVILCVITYGWADFNIVNFGAIGDGKIDDSQAFVKAWNATCQANVGAILQIPANKTFLLKGNIIFNGPCKSEKVQVSILGNIVAPEKAMWRICNIAETKWITFSDVNGLIVDGSGTFDGRGDSWWQPKNGTQNVAGCDSPNALAPTIIAFAGCGNLQVNRLSTLNSPRNHITISRVNGASISNLNLSAPGDSPNTDGIDISSSTNITIHSAFIATGDDCIAINDGSSFINISNVACGPGHGISVGSLGQGGSHSTVEEVHVFNCNFTKTQNGVRIKTWPGGSGYAKSIRFEQIRLTEVDNPIIIDQHYCNGRHDCPDKLGNVEVSSVTYNGVHGTSSQPLAITLNCSESVCCKKITMNDVNIDYMNLGQKAFAMCANVDEGNFSNTSPEIPCLASPTPPPAQSSRQAPTPSPELAPTSSQETLAIDHMEFYGFY